MNEVRHPVEFLLFLADVLKDAQQAVCLLLHPSQWKLFKVVFTMSVHFLIFLYFAQSSIISSWHFLNVLRPRGEFFTVSFLMGQTCWEAAPVCSWILYFHVHISPLFSVWHPWVVREQEWERRRGREVCDVFVWEMAGGYRFTVAGLAEGRKERLFKRLPTHSCSPIEPQLSATASHRRSPSAGREI